MSVVEITPKKLMGKIAPPPSKSDAHRAIICAALSKGKSTISPFSVSEDMKATIGAVKALGTDVLLEENCLIIDGTNTFSDIKSEINCLESGSTLRFLIPVAALSGKEITFTGKGRLPERPIGPYLDCLPKAGVSCETKGGLPLKIKGRVKPGTFTLPGNISSQFITGLLLALPLLKGDSKIVLSTPLQSKGYVDLTISSMMRFGVIINETENGYFIKGNQTYKSLSYKTEGDWSQAAFFLSAAAINKGSKVTCEGLSLNSKQGDRKIAGLLRNFGAEVTEDKDVTVSGKELRAIKINASQIPDLVPVIAAAAAFANGKTEIYGAERLRIKESDRLHTTTLALKAIGADIEETKDGLIISGQNELSGGESEGYNDHRIVMALAAAAVGCKNKVVIHGAECINKSYPAFFNDYNKLGGKADVINDR